MIGSLDILGNLTIYTTPRRSLINWPLGFCPGVDKGFLTFIRTVISSSLDIIDKISGSLLLSSCDELHGFKNIEKIYER